MKIYKYIFNKRIFKEHQDIRSEGAEKKPKTKRNIQIINENEIKIDQEMIREKKPFVRINTNIQFTGENIRLFEGEHPFTEEQEVGSIVIYPGYEVELKYKNIIRKTTNTKDGLVQIEDTDSTIHTHTYTGTHTFFKNVKTVDLRGGKIKLLKLILRPQIDIEQMENNIDTEYIRKNTKYVRIFPCNNFNCRYLQSSILKSENEDFKKINTIIRRRDRKNRRQTKKCKNEKKNNCKAK